MNCCEHKCTEGHNCPVRRVRAGGPPPSDLPAPGADFHPEDIRTDAAKELGKYARWIAGLLAAVFLLSLLAGFVPAK